MILDIKIKVLRDSACVPQRATTGSAAVDLCAAIEESLIIPAGKRVLVPCGIAVALPKNTVGIVSARSGLSSKKGITAANGIGVIDSDYRGEIFFSAVNLSDTDVVIEPGERVAQMMIMPVYAANFIPVDDLEKTARGAGGFGSTGK